MNDWQERGSEPLTEKQRKMLNGICGDLARQLDWHGAGFSRDDFRHLLSAVACSRRVARGWDYHDGDAPGFFLPGRSSLTLSKSQACDAITLGIQLGDDPASQGLRQPPVKWSDAVLLGLGYNPNDFR